MLDILAIAVPVVFAITVHEVAHGWVASRLGDDTAASKGRLTLNPLKHVDPIGTIVVPVVMHLAGGPLFGWAKPVPVDFRRLRSPRRDIALVALAGPAANLLMLIGWGIVLAMTDQLSGASRRFLLDVAEAGIIANTVLMVLNLFPVPPLDGSRVVAVLLPRRLAVWYVKLEPIGLIIVALLLVTQVLGTLIGPPIKAVLDFVARLALGN